MKLLTAGVVVAEPEDFNRIMSYSFEPLHPDAYGQQQAFRWRDALALRNAFDGGMHDAAREGEAHEKLKTTGMQA